MAASNTDGNVLQKGELADLARQAIDRIPDVMDRAESNGPANDKPVKILFFEVDPQILGYFQSGYNIFADLASRLLSKHAFDFANKALKNQKAAAVVTLGIEATLKSGEYVRRVVAGSHEDYREKKTLARTLAPILDEIKGSHSVAALFSVKPQENEMIYAQARRIKKQHEVATFGRFIDLGMNAVPNLSMSLPHVQNYWKYGNPNGPVMPASTGGEGNHNDNGMGDFKAIVPQIINGTMPAIALKIKESKVKQLHKTQQPYSALEMVLKLEEEVGKNPGASAFAAPHDGGSFSLEEYVAKIMVQHSRDMADINHDYTEIRKAMKPDVEALAKPIAEAIKKGDLAPITLVRWVGEGKLVKEKGRKLATAEEVQTLLGRAEKAPPPPVRVDPKEYYVDAAFNQKELKAALGALQGEERIAFAAMFPDSVLGQAGLKDQEIKAIRDHTLQSYETMLAHAVAGLAAKTDAELVKEGLGQEEIKQLRDAVEAMHSKGPQAIHELKSNHANTNGVERALTNWAVPRVKDGTHLGTLISKGKEQLAAAAAAPKPAEKPSEDATEDKATDAADKADKTDKDTDTHDKADTHVAALQQQSGSDMAAEQAR